MGQNNHYLEKQIEWWKKVKFGMFVHWGLYSHLGGMWKGWKTWYYSEWIMNTRKIPDAEYSLIAKQFNPTKFSATAWVKLAKEAGMKYLIFTACHHEGFSMYHSGITDYNIVDATPFKRDPLKELAAACKSEGIKLGLYYSLLDWHRSQSPSTFGVPLNFSKYYYEHVRNQIKELLTNYGEISILFFDADWAFQWNEKLGCELRDFIRSLQPGIILNDRIGKRPITSYIPIVKSIYMRPPQVGDYTTIEQAIPYRPKNFLWEANITMNRSWGYKKHDHHWKSTSELIQLLTKAVNNNGNLLLNVGPTGEGEIPEPSVQRLREIGEWLRTHRLLDKSKH